MADLTANIFNDIVVKEAEVSPPALESLDFKKRLFLFLERF